jgi:hypothetical protein
MARDEGRVPNKNTCGAKTAFFGRYRLKNAVFAPQVFNFTSTLK